MGRGRWCRCLENRERKPTGFGKLTDRSLASLEESPPFSPGPEAVLVGVERAGSCAAMLSRNWSEC
jgi:hypothetical protein